MGESDCGVVSVISGKNGSDVAEGFWFHDTGPQSVSIFSGFGGQLRVFDILRKGVPGSVLAVASQPNFFDDGVVFFDIARISRSERLEDAAIWEAIATSPGLQLRTLKKK